MTIMVVQCAARKRKNAGYMRMRSGRNVLFVADPAVAPTIDHFCARPDDASDLGGSWRDQVIRYNESPGCNPLNLSTAVELYANETYRVLARNFGLQNTYILSAGWGLIPSTFLTPCYDITFAAGVEKWKRRQRSDHYLDLCSLSRERSDEIIFLGGADYVPLFVRLTSGMPSKRTVFYNSAVSPDAPGCDLIRYQTKTRTNWHYECAHALVDGTIKL